jgi:LPXTG-motif cell wall-anchored protein
MITAVAIGGVVFASPASAHTSDWSVTCDSVSVHLKDYNKRVTNSVTLKIVGGEGALADNPDFGSTFTYTGALPPHDAPLQVRLVVTAGDGSRYNVDQVKTSQPCEKPPTTPPPTTAPPTTAPPTTAPPTTAPPTTVPPTTTAPPTTPTTTAPPTSSAPAVPATTSPASGDLAETGSSNATPVIAGIAAAAVVVGAGALVITRKRRSSSHR